MTPGQNCLEVSKSLIATLHISSVMCCNPDDIVGNLILLDLPFVNVLREQIKELNNVLFNQSEERTELLCDIISFTDDDLKWHLENIEKNKLENELTQFYFGMGFIKKSEESFITGNMDIAEQCNVWSNVISCLKGLQNQPSLIEKYENPTLLINKLIHNPAFKEILNKRITVVNSAQCKKNVIDINNIREELVEINNNIKELNEILFKSFEENIDESSAPLLISEELKKTDHENVHKLLTEWVNNIQSRGSIHHDMNNMTHFSQLSSGYESGQDESNFEDSFYKDFSATILLLHNNCKSVSEFICSLKEIKQETTKILSSVENKEDAVKSLLSYINALKGFMEV